MLTALIAVLGVDLIVVVVFLGFLLSRKRWVKRQPGSFRGDIRVASGELEDLGPKWSRGYGRWVSDVLVWTKAPFLFGHAFEVAASDDDRERLLGPHRQPAAAAEAAAIAAQPTPT